MSIQFCDHCNEYVDTDTNAEHFEVCTYCDLPVEDCVCDETNHLIKEGKENNI